MSKTTDCTKAVGYTKENISEADFLARLSHEFRTPLNGILGLAELALDEENPEIMKEYLAQIVTSGKYMQTLFSDISDMSKIESREIKLLPDVYHYDEFIESIMNIVEPLCAEKHIQLIQNIEAEHVSILVDKERFNQIFLNLFTNAIKFTPENGRITYTYHNKKVNNCLQAEFIIQDTGSGISEEFQKHMYEPFTQESNEVIAPLQGTGIGLPIVKALVELMGGNLQIESCPGKGTTATVHLCLPIAACREIKYAEKSLDQKTVLIVEDHPLNRMIVTRLLEKKGIRVIEAENGAEAVSLFQKEKEGCIDCILMDVRMPYMDGLEATRIIRGLSRTDAISVPIIAMTANVYDEDREKTQECGMNDYLEKPVCAKVLYKILERYCG
ncbi:MAG: response regulator [Lachnospiraceae bacterium]|nr:response regulator [Lachnospiraceae bacterium]